MTDLKSTLDEELARQTQAGSMAAFEELVCRFERRIYAFVANFSRNEADAREVTQDTFVRAFQRIARYDPHRPFAAWLFTIARRRCIDRHRTAGAVWCEPEPELVELNEPSELLAQREDRQRLWDVARRLLPEAQYNALWLRYAEDMEVAQIARVLRKTRTHVKVLLFRARQALGRELREHEPEAQFTGAPDDTHTGRAGARAAAVESNKPPRGNSGRFSLLLAGRKVCL